ncbi:MAG: chemotaxis protein CheX [Desulfatitalea sp.]|nr:chemotaxis protein CheX [Desulfatitalea sp.]NNK02033.1 chemotaxis protein CheX [Desulfatitalea sp.]
MDPNYIKPFVIAAKRIFETMITVPFSLGKPVLKTSNEVPHEISSIIGISGNVSGCVVLSLSEEVAFQLASALIGEEVNALDEDCTDAIGEIANMIAGNAKTDFPSKDNSISVPSVVVGKHKVTYPSGIPIITIPCKTDKGEIIIEVALKEKEA